MENAGTCYKDGASTGTYCKYTKKQKDEFCCDEDAVGALAANQYCRKGDNCMDISATEHYQPPQPTPFWQY